jgi:hypothetical protein
LPSLPRDFTATNPEGSLQEEHLKACQLIYDTGEQRRKILEEKSTRTLSLVAALTPLIVSAAVYTGTGNSLAARQRQFILTIDAVAFCFLLLAFIAAVRATGIRTFHSLHIGTVIDEEKGTIKAFSPNIFGRGLLWCAAVNAAVHDHLADFVRASQLFLVWSVILLLISATLVMFTLEPKPPVQEIKGTVQIEPGTLQQLSTSIAGAAAPVAGGVSSAAEALQRVEEKLQHVDTLDQRLQVLNQRVTALEKAAQKPSQQKGHSLGSTKRAVKQRH